MIKVTFQGQDGVYWAVCESVSYILGGGYLLDSVQKDNCGGPHRWVKVPENWKIMLIEEA